MILLIEVDVGTGDGDKVEVVGGGLVGLGWRVIVLCLWWLQEVQELIVVGVEALQR